MPALRTKPLTADTWADFAALAEAHNGVWSGCWCMAFHDWDGKGVSPEANRAEKELRVRDDRAHAALVYSGDECVGWCQFGVTDELPNIKNRRAYEKALDQLPDWRITCFFVGRGHRRQGVAKAGLAGAVREIARLGGGLVEGYPDDTTAGTSSASFLWSGTLDMFERERFERVRQIGKAKWVVRRKVRRVAQR
jgi:hypothetical protein